MKRAAHFTFTIPGRLRPINALVDEKGVTLSRRYVREKLFIAWPDVWAAVNGATEAPLLAIAHNLIPADEPYKSNNPATQASGIQHRPL